MANTLKIKRGTAATIPQGQLAEPLFTTDTYDLYIGKGAGGNQRIQNYIASGTSSQFLKGDGTLDSTSYQPLITAGTTLQYYRGDKTFQTLDTSVVPENGPIYFTEPRVRATVLTGLNLSGGGTIAATDSILTAFGKVQNQISALVGGATYQGTWNANTNTPILSSGTGTKGYYYVVSVAGSTNLDGITDWKIGDWAIFNGTTWDKVDNTDAVSSVNGFTGAVNLALDNISDVSAASPTNAQLLRYNGTSSAWENWTPNYITGNQTITLSGDVSGSGTTTIATTIGAGKVTNAMLAGSIAASKLVGTDIATVGTITTGIWNGTTIAIADGGTGATTKAAAFNALSPMTTLGDIIYGGASGAGTRLAGNTAASKRFLIQTGDGTNSAAPSWGSIAAGDVPTLNQNTTGNAGTATKLATARDFTINGTAKSFDGSANVSWTAAEIGLTSYLPLTGGTLTGALSGTSATFSGNLTTNSGINYFNGTTDSVTYYQIGSTSGGHVYLTSTKLELSAYSTRNMIFETNGVTRLTISSTGAATFSSTITAATLSTIGTAVAGQNVQLNLNGVSGKAQRIEFQNSGVQQWLLGAGAASETGAFEIFNSTGIISLSINKSTNAATFSSSIRANAASTIYGATQDAIQTIFTLGGQNASAQAKELYFRLTAGGTPAWTLQTAAVGTDTNFNIFPNGTAGLSIAYAGAATFSSSVTAQSEYAYYWQRTGASPSNLWSWSANASSAYLYNHTSTSVILTVLNGGNVGIGTTSPTAILHVEQSVDGSMPIRLRNSFGATSNTNSTVDILSELVSSTNAGQIGSRIRTGKEGDYSSGATRDAYLSFATAENDNLTERMRITSGGTLAIGKTSSQGKALELYQATNAALRIQNSTTGTSNNDGLLIEVGGSDVLFYNYESGNMLFGTADTERMRITSGGDVGIGQTSPNLTATNRRVLDINGTSSTLIALSTGGTAKGYIFHGGTNMAIANYTNGGSLDFNTNNGSDLTRMTITSGGEVLINTTTDSGAYYLQVNGSVYATAYYESSDIRLKDVLTNSYSENFSAIEFMWKDKRDEKKHWGYAAQDVMKYIPDAIEVNNDGMMTVNYNEAHTWKISQLEKEILELKAKIK